MADWVCLCRGPWKASIASQHSGTGVNRSKMRVCSATLVSQCSVAAEASLWRSGLRRIELRSTQAPAAAAARPWPRHVTHGAPPGVAAAERQKLRQRRGVARAAALQEEQQQNDWNVEIAGGRCALCGIVDCLVAGSQYGCHRQRLPPASTPLNFAAGTPQAAAPATRLACSAGEPPGLPATVPACQHSAGTG